jgi:hypothetical protein
MAEQAEYHEFDENAINEAIASMQELPEPMMAAGGVAGLNLADSGEVFVAAQCISVTVRNRKICLSLPFGIGRICLPVPSWVPNGTAAEACIGICTTWKIPTGVRLTVSVAGRVILQKKWGKC